MNRTEYTLIEPPASLPPRRPTLREWLEVALLGILFVCGLVAGYGVGYALGLVWA